jgi:catechol 2,3-dioxygenase-like lactoylglutathione lyase family enzyme
MPINARYVHTNLIALDWRKLVQFYCDVFGCVPVPPERDLSGPVLEKGTGVPGAHLMGMHLRLPGGGEDGPTLEIYSYTPVADVGVKAINRPGYGHLAFQVDDLQKAREMVLEKGGRALGEIVTTPVGTDRQVSWCYLTDPEGNAIELQIWNTRTPDGRL